MVASPSKPPLADRLRERVCRALARGVPVEDESLRLDWALMLGWKTALTEEISKPFVWGATRHIFSVDGLPMAIIFGIFFCLFRALRLPRTVRRGRADANPGPPHDRLIAKTGDPNEPPHPPGLDPVAGQYHLPSTIDQQEKLL
jgi:hypothetical protein